MQKFPFTSQLCSAAIAAALLLTGCTTADVRNEQPQVAATQQTEAPLIPIENFFNEQSIRHLKMSDDGKWLAFVKEYQGASNIFLMEDKADLASATPLTKSVEPIRAFEWSAKGNDLFFMKDKGGNENTQIYKLSFEEKAGKITAKEQRLTHKDDVQYSVLEQVKDNPDLLVVQANHDDSSRMDIYLLNINDGKLTPILKNEQSFTQVKFNKQGQPVIASSSNLDNTNALYVLIDGKWRKIIQSAKGESIDILKVNDAQKLAYISANIGDRDKQELLKVDLMTGKYETIHKDPDNEADVFGVQFSDAGEPLAVGYYGGRLRVYPLNAEFARHWDVINRHFNQDVEITIGEMNEKTHLWQIHVASDRAAGADYQYNATTGDIHLLVDIPASIPADQLSPRQSIVYTARDGVKIQAYLTLPKGKQTQLPTIILPHGGPWARDFWTLDSGYFHAIAQFYANRGYAVLQPNFRASTGFGKKFLNLGNRNWGIGSMQHDLTDGANYLVEQGIADKQRLGIFGASYGGYAALSGATFTPDLYHAVIAYVGPSSLVTLMNSFPDYWRPYLGQWFESVGDPQIAEQKQDMENRSPINYVDNIKAPLMLIQGANDPRVTQIESDNIAKKMYQKSLPVKYVLAKDEGHGFSKRANKLASIVATEQFFAEHLGGRVDTNVDPEILKHLDSLNVDISKL
ncbi:S9 family peptidase [Shewanella sp. DNRA4]|uniref:prolyl oligopeptidase family serine peptidase n=1 Tax=Shewanella sp. DNRA4 TaxID=2723055 RepID=UPI00146AB629|nr:prolyl oligopeptidase family serine peptidase [Shewanella sp. DNRA4]NMD51590.1 S9 family peptidase [Shewanella sp. DNRA4]